MAIRSDWVNGEQWNAADQNEVNAAVLGAQPVSEKGQPNGYASLDATGKVPASQLSASGMQRVISSSSVPVTLPNAPSTDYVYFLGGTPGSGGGAGDPHWSSVTSLLNFNSAVTTDLATGAPTWTNNGPTVLSTSTKKFGASSLYISTDGWSINTNNYSGFDIGGGIPFTIEMWAYPISISGDRVVFSMREWNGYFPFFIGQQNGQLRAWVGNSALNNWELNGAYLMANAFVAYAWTHIAIVGTGTEMYFFVNGAPIYAMLQPSWPSANRLMRIGGDPWWNWWTGHFDDFRFTRGVARYTNSFLIPTSEFPTFAQPTVVDPIYGNPTLPTAVGNTNVYTLRNTFSLPLTVSTTSSQTIEGMTSFTIDPGESFNFISDGSNWRII